MAIGKNKFVWRTTLLAALTVIAAGCASDDDASLEVAPLPEFSARFEPDPVWTATLDTTVWESIGLSLGSAWRAVWPWAGAPDGDRPVDTDVPQLLTPVVYQDRIYAATPEGLVQAFDRDGKTLWRMWLGSPVSGGLNAGAGLVILGTADGEVVALNHETGEEKWRNLVSSEVIAPAAIAENTVVVRTVDGKLFALNADNGERLWLADRSVPLLTQRGTSTPMIAGGLAIAGFDNGKVTAFRLNNGQELWEKRIAQPTGRSEIERIADSDTEPLIFGSTLYVASMNGSVMAIDMRNAETLWQREMSTYRNMGIDEQALYVANARGHLSALDRASGFVMWTQKALENRRLTTPVAFGDYVVVGDFEGYLHFLSRDKGEFLARVSVDGDGFRGNPVVAGDRLIVFSHDGELQVYQQR